MEKLNINSILTDCDEQQISKVIEKLRVAQFEGRKRREVQIRADVENMKRKMNDFLSLQREKLLKSRKNTIDICAEKIYNDEKEMKEAYQNCQQLQSKLRDHFTAKELELKQAEERIKKIDATFELRRRRLMEEQDIDWDNFEKWAIGRLRQTKYACEQIIPYEGDAVKLAALFKNLVNEITESLA